MYGIRPDSLNLVILSNVFWPPPAESLSGGSLFSFHPSKRIRPEIDPARFIRTGDPLDGFMHPVVSLSYLERRKTEMAERDSRMLFIEKRVCARCKRDLNISDFAKSELHKNGTTGICRECSSAQKRAAHRRRKVHIIQEKGGKCAMCGGEFPPCAFDLHHVIPGRKSSRLSVKYCEHLILLCSNCHRILHDQIRNGLKAHGNSDCAQE